MYIFPRRIPYVLYITISCCQRLLLLIPVVPTGVSIIVFWRPSDVMSVRAVAIFTQLVVSLRSSGVSLVTVLSPKYTGKIELILL